MLCASKTLVGFPSLEFPNRDSLTAHEIAMRLRCSFEHVLNLVCDGSLSQCSEASRPRSAVRVGAESYHAFVRARTLRAGCLSETARELLIPSLDFPKTPVLRLEEIAQRIGVTDAHLTNLIERGELAAVDICSENARRHAFRVPIEAYRQYLNGRMTCGRRDT